MRGGQADRDAIGDKRGAAARADLPEAILAHRTLAAEFWREDGRACADADCASRGVLAEQRPLGPAQHCDLIEID
jgi:hypothetical protein